MDVTRSTIISRVCYDSGSWRMLVERHAVYHQYCDLRKDTLDALLNAPSMGRYYRVSIDGAGESKPYDCRTHKVPSDQ